MFKRNKSNTSNLWLNTEGVATTASNSKLVKRRKKVEKRAQGTQISEGLFSWVEDASRIPYSVRKQLFQEVESIIREKTKNTITT